MPIYDDLHQQLYHSTFTMFILTTINLANPFEKIQRRIFTNDRLWLINGHKCETTNGLYREFQEKMSFPVYKRANWDAMFDWMNELHPKSDCESKKELRRQSQFVIINNAAHLIKLKERDRQLFIETIATFENDCWNTEGNDREGVYRFILTCTPKDYSIISSMLVNYKVSYINLIIPDE